jgi:hypothetical protein
VAAPSQLAGTVGAEYSIQIYKQLFSLDMSTIFSVSTRMILPERLTSLSFSVARYHRYECLDTTCCLLLYIPLCYSMVLFLPPKMPTSAGS